MGKKRRKASKIFKNPLFFERTEGLMCPLFQSHCNCVQCAWIICIRLTCKWDFHHEPWAITRSTYCYFTIHIIMILWYEIRGEKIVSFFFYIKLIFRSHFSSCHTDWVSATLFTVRCSQFTIHNACVRKWIFHIHDNCCHRSRTFGISFIRL